MTVKRIKARELDDLQREVLKQVRGRVLEIGPGKGRFLDALPKDIDWIGIEPAPRQRDELAMQAARRGLRPPIDASAELIPVPSHSVDTVLGMYVLCSIPNVTEALQEVCRVLRRGGQALFVEHVAAERGTILRVLQRTFTPITLRIDHGCHLDRETEAALRGSELSILSIRRFRCLGQPILVAHLEKQTD